MNYIKPLNNFIKFDMYFLLLKKEISLILSILFHKSGKHD